MNMSDNNNWRQYRTRAEADALLPQARAIAEEVQRRIPADKACVLLDTLFVGTMVPRLVACVAVSLVGIPGALAPLEFRLDDDFDATVDMHVKRILAWRAREESRNSELPRQDT